MNIQANNKNIEVEVPEGYKKTPVGMIPEDWEVSKLEQVATIQNGRGYSHLNDGEIPVYASGGIINYVDDYLNEGESVGIGRKGTIDKPQLLKGKYWVVDTLFYINEFKNVLPYFLYSQFAQVNWYKYNESSGLPSLIKNTIKKIPLAIPPLPEQKAIADCLSTWDKGIEKLSALIASKKEQKKGLMQQLLTGKKRLDGFTEKWEEMRLGEILEESKIISEENDKSKRISVRLHLEGVHKRPVRGTEADSTTFYKRKSGQFIYGKQNFHNGSLGIIPEEFDGFETTSDLPSFNINNKVNHNWFFYYISRFVFYSKMESKTTGTGSKRLHPRELFSTKIPKLSIEEQTAIAEVLTTADKEIELLEQKLESYKTQKKGLMQVLLTGALRLCSGTNGLVEN